MERFSPETAARVEDCSVITALCVNVKMPLVAFLAALQQHADSGCVECAAIARADELLELEADAPCPCRQSEADLFDAVGCDYHDPNSPRNVRLRVVTAVSTIPARPKGVNSVSRNHDQNPELFPGSGMQCKSFKDETSGKKGERTMNEVVKFQNNTPVEVTLQDEAGKRVEGRYGEQVMYSLLDNRVMYVPLYVEQRFQELAIAAGEPLVLCKQRDGRNRTEWSVKRAPLQLSMAPNGTAAADFVVPVPTPGLQAVGRIREAEIVAGNGDAASVEPRTEEHTSELQ